MNTPDFLELGGKAILITGASSGIGREAAIRASRFGARIVLVARREDELRVTLSLMSGTDHVVSPFDLADLDAIPDFVRTLASQIGGLDGLVHCAGQHSAIPLRTMRATDVRELMGANVSSAFMLAKGFRHRQVRRAGASIVLMSSAVGLVGQAGVSLYSASKGAIIAATKSLALELAREGVRVNCVCAGVVETEMTAGLKNLIGDRAFADVAAAHPLGLGRPDDVANMIMYLLSAASRWVTGSAFVVDGGYTAQ